jgi:glutaredoxin
MIKVIGTHGCSRCEQVKRILQQKQIQFEYVMFGDLSESEQTHLTEWATKEGKLGLPLIIKDDCLIDMKDVI